MNRFLCMVAGLSAAALLIAGCGGTSLSSNVSRIRAYNGANGTSATATIYINNGSANGDQNYEQVTQYLYVNSGTSTFAWSVNGLTGGSTTPFSANLNSGGVYSTLLLGNATETLTTSSPFLDITADDQTSPPAGQSRIRLIHDAPDAGTIDVYINGVLYDNTIYNANNAVYTPPSLSSGQIPYEYPGTTLTGLTSSELSLGTPFSLENFGYYNVPAGTVTIKVTEAGNPSAVILPTTSYSVSSGNRYTFFLLEPTTTSPYAYTIQEIGDSL